MIVDLELQEGFDRQARELERGMWLNARMIKHYYDILVDAELPPDIIAVAIEAWCAARNRMEVEPMLHHMFMQQHQAHEGEDADSQHS